MKKFDWMAGAALAMAIVGTASAEYNLAVAAGWGQVAFALPGCLDIYALRALRAHRDMLSVLAVLIVVNSVSHLIAVGLLAPSVWVVIGVSSIAPAVLWRVHALRDAVTEPARITSLSGEVIEDPVQEALDLVEAPAAPEPVTLERVPEVEPEVFISERLPQLGPMVPVAELLAGTSRDQPDSFRTGERKLSPEPAEPEPALLTVADVAKAMDVAEGTVRSWVSRNKLTPAQRDDNGRLLFHPDAVAALT